MKVASPVGRTHGSRSGAAIGALRIGVEVVDSRLPIGSPVLMELADDLNNGAYVLGTANPAWRHLRYADQPISLRWNDGTKTTEIATGDGRPILDGDPVAAVVLIANLAALAPRGLCAGDVVTTGSCTGAIAIPGAGAFEADFGTLGSVRLRVS